MDFGKVILKAINHNHWLRIDYQNKTGDITKFMIGIKHIDKNKKMFRCDVFNLTYSSNVQIDYFIFYENILDAYLLEDTYYETPQKLLEYIRDNPEAISFLNPQISREDLLEYYVDCFKLDTIPYVSKYGLVKGIDVDKLLEEDVFELNDEQFETFAKESFYKKENKKRKHELKLEKIDQQLVVNELSIQTEKGLYVLAYRNLVLDLKRKVLVAEKQVTINKEFQYDLDTNSVRKKDSIYRFFPEEKQNLLEEFSLNIEHIVKAIREYNSSRNLSYQAEIHYDRLPHIICLERKYPVDIELEMFDITRLLYSEEGLSLPLQTFFGNPEQKLARRINYPIFTIDKRYNMDQIKAIHIGMKSPVSYIQGPPGTGKTQTLLNAIFTALFNNHTVLVTSNNNIPMDGVYGSICELKYKNREQLLFPAIRLGSQIFVERALYKIRDMYEKSLKLEAKEDRIKRIKEKRKEANKKLVELLDRYERAKEIQERLDGLKIFYDKCKETFLGLSISEQIEKAKMDLEKIGEVSMDHLENYIDVDQNELFMAIHFETAGRLQNLKKTKFLELYEIVKDVDESNIESKANQFRKYLKSEQNLKKFQEIFPVIITTNLSSTYLGKPGKCFDIVMMDEAGQCNITNALIPISRADKLMLVGDPQQLQPVIVLDEGINKRLKDKYKIPDEYDYTKNSIYTTFTKIDVVNNETLLSYHYRCNKKIIDFSNKKYYNNQLKIHSKSEEMSPLLLVDTSKSLERQESRNVSYVEAQEIVKYIRNNPDENVGVITPFVRQKNCIENYLERYDIYDISVGTVHSFQGDQKNTIIFSTAITKSTAKSTYNWLKNNRELINVAVSRAKNKLIVLGNKEAIKTLSDGQDDMKELIEYVESAGESKVTNVSPESFALGTRIISSESEKVFSETLNHVFSVLNTNCFIRNEVALSSLFTNENVSSSLYYMQRFDVVIFERIYDKEVPLLAIEVDGPEHVTDEEVKRRDQEKELFCKKHNFILERIPRDCIRDYKMIKNVLLEFIRLKK